MCFLFVHFVVVVFFLFFVFVFFWGGGIFVICLFVCLYLVKKVFDKYQICYVRQIQKIDLLIYMHHINDKPVEHPNANYMN